jgi:D-sedoheptulose 7-phosphate isomerase
MIAVGLTGSGGCAMREACDLCLCVPSDETPIIQQLHITAAHIICGMVEERLFPRPGINTGTTGGTKIVSPA